MDFSFKTDTLEIRDGARKYLRDRFSAESLRSLLEQGSSDPEHWSEIAEMGFCAYLIPENAGGLGLNELDLSLLAEEAGYVALPEPLLDVAGIAAPLVAELERSHLDSLISGDYRVLSWHPLNPFVNQWRETDFVLKFSADAIALVQPEDLKARFTQSIDPLRSLCAPEPLREQVLIEGVAAESLCKQAANRGALFTAAELLGLSARMIDMSTAYAQERKQFGKAIGSFQAVKHHLSSVFVQLEFARPVLYRAAVSLAANDARACEHVAHAKLAAIKLATSAAETAIQIHGGIGYTYEADLHLWMKRAWALNGLWGDTHHHTKVLEAALLKGTLPCGPSATFNNFQES